MELRLVISIISLLCFSLLRVEAQEIAKLDIAGYQKTLSASKSQLKVVNFWATWCAPCLKELPDLMDIHRDFQPQVDVIFISLDTEQRKKLVLEKMKSYKPNASTFLLDVKDEYLDALYAQWHGAVPLTLIYNDQNELIEAFEKEIDYAILKKVIIQNSK